MGSDLGELPSPSPIAGRLPGWPLSRRSFVRTAGVAVAGGLLGCDPRLRASPGAPSGAFESLGAPVGIGRFHGKTVGPDSTGRTSRVYFAFAQALGRQPFLLVVDPDTGACDQYFPPEGVRVGGFKSLYPGRDGRVYVGGYKPGRLLRFDPRRPEDGLEDLGRVPGAAMVWWMVEAADGRLYMSSSPEARLASWGPESGRIRDHGRLSEENEYATVLRSDGEGRRLFAVVAPQRFDVVEYDVTSGETRGRVPEELRGTGFIGMPPNPEGTLAFEMPDPDTRVVHLAPIEVDFGPDPHVLADGRDTRASDAETLVVTDLDGGVVRHPLRYRAATQVFTIHPTRDGSVYAFSYAPIRLCVYDERGGDVRVLGRPFQSVNGSVGAVLEVDGRLVMAGYAGCEVASWDPAVSWQPGTGAGANPVSWGRPDGEGHTRPMDMVRGPDGLIYLGSDSSYGTPGGAVAVLDPGTGRFVRNVREPFRARSVRALAADPDLPLVFVGCGQVGGGDGGQERPGSVVALDTDGGRVRWDVAPVDGAAYVTALHRVPAGLFGATMHDYETQHVFLLDPETGRTLDARKTGVEAVVHANLRIGPDGWAYGLGHSSGRLFRVRPDTLEVETLARVPRMPVYGLGVSSRGLYFGSGGDLMRFRFDEPLAPGGSPPAAPEEPAS